jgi:hypothetical protein
MRIETLTIALVLLGLSCAETPAPLGEKDVFAEVSASQLKSEMEKTGFKCSATGRELYPLLFECEAESSVNLFLYADDMGRLEGIRAFGPSDSGPSWMKTALEILFNEDTGSLLLDRIAAQRPQKVFLEEDQVVVEVEYTGDRAILRLSPKSAVRN